jgi:hypothetical protein
MADPLAARWYSVFTETLQTHEASVRLRQAAMDERLEPWTRALTDVVISTFGAMGWTGGAKGHQCRALPVSRQEYLSLDAVAFSAKAARRWTFPAAVFELENGRRDDTVAYSLWKVLTVRDALRVVVCYRSDSRQGSALIRHLSDGVVEALGVDSQHPLGGECLVVVGSRSDQDAFPYGFFKPWLLDASNRRFVRA